VTGYGAAIFGQHAALLEASAIDPEVARERGYVSVDTKAELSRRGFRRSQQHAPGLLIPIFGTDGERRLYQYRPDEPREINGKRVRYETPAGTRLCLDVPKRTRPFLADVAIPLWITEGARKADAAVTAGLACIALLGVDSWRSLPDWGDVVLKRREVVVCFDSDVMTKQSVAGALATFTQWLAYRGAVVKHVILPGDGEAKAGLDDYLAAGHTVEDLRTLAVPAADPAAGLDGAALLREVEAFLKRFIAFPSEAAAVAVTLWAAHAHAVDSYDSTPRLALLSPEPGSGKTRTLECLELLTPRPMLNLNASVAAIFRTIDKARPTLLLDEADAIFTSRGRDDTNEDLRALLNSGHRRRMPSGRPWCGPGARSLTCTASTSA
jgi:hypothetical protein